MRTRTVPPKAREVLTDYVNGSDHPDLVVYRADFGSKFSVDWWLKGILARCQVGNFFGKDILEAGCGFGWDAAALSVLGGNRVVAVDILPSMIDGAAQCLAAAREKGHDLRVEPVQGDICNLDLPSASFDGIYSSEAIEHVHDLEAMFERCLELLKPGGRMLIANDSNRHNSAFRNATIEMWHLRDRSWDHAVWLKQEVRPVEHADAEPYHAMRRRIIAELDPDLAEDELEELATATAGLTRGDIREVALAARKGAPLPQPPEFAWCRNPETGEYAERLLDPFELREMLRAAGFRKVRLRHAFGRFPLTWLNGLQAKPVNLWLFERRPMFMLVAER